MALPPPPPPSLNPVKTESYKDKQKSSPKPAIESTTSSRYEWRLNDIAQDVVFDTQSSSPISDLAHVPWKEVIVLSSSNSGSSGVFFVLFTGNRSLVLKGSSTVASEYFANIIGAKISLTVPQMRLISYLHSSDWDDMAGHLQAFELAALSRGGTGTRLGKCLMSPFMLVMEHVHGFNLEEIGSKCSPQELPAVLNDASLLKELGRIIALDVLLNNFDRFPIVWDNEGNPHNVIINTKNATIRGIDNNLTSIDPVAFKSNFDKYSNKVVALLTTLVSSGTTEETIYGSQIRTFLLSYTGCDIGPQGSIAIQNGIVEAANSIVKQFGNDTESQFQQIKKGIEEELAQAMQLMGVTSEACGLSRINTTFLTQMVEVFKKGLGQ